MNTAYAGTLFEDAEVISLYTRAQALADGDLVDVTEWASADKGFRGGFRCPVAMTRALFAFIDIDHARRRTPRQSCEDTRGRAHDALWMGSLALRALLARDRVAGDYRVLFSGRYKTLHIVLDGDGVTIGFPEDF